MNGEPTKQQSEKTVRPTMFQIARAWWAARQEASRKRAADRRFVRNQKLFLTLLKDKRSGLEDVCRRHAQIMARSMVMNYLDSKGVLHCRFCEQTGPLHLWGPMGAQDRVCEGHLKALSGGAKVVKVPTAAEAVAAR